MVRRRSTPWIYLRSRLIIGAIAVLGTLLTGYLTIVKLTGGSAACPTDGCDKVLNSPYASVFGIPLTIVGCLAYVAMAALAFGPLFVDPAENKTLHSSLEEKTWIALFAGGTAMTIFSGYLIYLLVTEIQATCIYCLTSAAFSVAMFVLVLIGRAWEDIGQLLFTGIVIGMISLVGIGVYSNVAIAPTPNPTETASNQGDDGGQKAPPVTTTSGPAEMALAQHLQEIGAKEYGAYWCPHCYEQKQMFGKEAKTLLNYVECDPEGANADPEACQAAGVKGYPSWEINGELHSGVRPLQELARLSGYEGPMDFKNSAAPAR